MANVIVHQYEGTDPFCERCQLPRKNETHQPDNTILITATYPNGTSDEFWTTEFTPMQLSTAINQLLADAVSDDTYDEPTYLEDPDVTD